jgi:hypothetical protein
MHSPSLSTMYDYRLRRRSSSDLQRTRRSTRASQIRSNTLPVSLRRNFGVGEPGLEPKQNARISRYHSPIAVSTVQTPQLGSLELPQITDITHSSVLRALHTDHELESALASAAQAGQWAVVTQLAELLKDRKPAPLTLEALAERSSGRVKP